MSINNFCGTADSFREREKDWGASLNELIKVSLCLLVSLSASLAGRSARCVLSVTSKRHSRKNRKIEMKIGLFLSHGWEGVVEWFNILSVLISILLKCVWNCSIGVERSNMLAQCSNESLRRKYLASNLKCTARNFLTRREVSRWKFPSVPAHFSQPLIDATSSLTQFRVEKQIYRQSTFAEKLSKFISV